jgi:glycosyltransferase involved in cell wall biosynthesis
MKIAILGSRGIPNHHGGFEQYATQLSVFLVRQGWEVVVYNSSRHPYQKNNYNGVIIKHKYDPEHRIGTIGQFIYDLGCILDTRKVHYDLIYQLGYTSSAIFNFLLPKNSLLVTNMDGLEWKRSKYNKAVQAFLKYSERLVVRKSNFLIADSPAIQNYLDRKYNARSFYSAYTAAAPEGFNWLTLIKYDLKPYRYFLIIARMEPENNIEMIIEGYLQGTLNYPLVIVGSTSTRFGKRLLRKFGDKGLRFIGPVYDKMVLDQLRHFSCLYFHGHSVGGTNPSLLEAMACSCGIVAHDNEFNKSILENNALYFSDKTGVSHAMMSTISRDFELAIANNLKKIACNYSEISVFMKLKNKMQEWVKAKK